MLMLKLRTAADEDALVNSSLVRQIVPMKDHIKLVFTDGTETIYLNSLVAVEKAIRKAGKCGDAIAKVRAKKIAVPTTCPSCDESETLGKCPNCGAKACCGDCETECLVCGYMWESHDEYDAAQTKGK